MPDFDDQRPSRPAPPDHLIRNVVIGMAVAIFVLAVVFLFVVTRQPEEPTPAEPAVAEATATPTTLPTASPTPTPTPTPTPEPTPPNHAIEGNLQSVAFVVAGSLSASLQKALPADQASYAGLLADQLAAALAWKINVKKDVRKGDQVKIVYNPTARTSRVPLYAFWYKSKRLNKEFFYVHFPTTGPASASFFDRDGHGILETLQRPPIPEEMMATTTIKPEGEDGLIFDVPLHTKVIMPFPARVLRLNWDLENLGRSIEVRYLDSGVVAQFCHLETISDKVQEGALLTSGSAVATTGDTGNTLLPRLLYRTQRVGPDDERTPVSPFEVHGRQTNELPVADHAAFFAAVKRIEKLFSQISTGAEVTPTPAVSEE